MFLFLKNEIIVFQSSNNNKKKIKALVSKKLKIFL
jgi:hypothetical protein